MSRMRLRLSKGDLTAGQKSAEGIVGHAVGKASEALRCRKVESTDRPIANRHMRRHATIIGAESGLSKSRDSLLVLVS